MPEYKEKLFLIRGARIENQLLEAERIENDNRIIFERMEADATYIDDREDINSLIEEFYRLDNTVLTEGIFSNSIEKLKGFGNKISQLSNKAINQLKDSRPVANFAGKARNTVAKYREKFGNDHPATKAAEEIAQHGEKNPKRSAFVTTMLNGLTALFGKPQADEVVTKALDDAKTAIDKDVSDDYEFKRDQEEKEVKAEPDEPITKDMSSGGTTYPILRTNINQIKTKKRQFATGPVSVKSHSIVVSTESNVIDVKAAIISKDSDTPDAYNTVVQFSNVKFHDADSNGKITFTAADNQQYHITPIVLSKKNVKVRCNCLDFYHRFSEHNGKDGSLHGKHVPYTPTTDRASDNPSGLPGVCKHLIKTIAALKKAGLVV